MRSGDALPQLSSDTATEYRITACAYKCRILQENQFVANIEAAQTREYLALS